MNNAPQPLTEEVLLTLVMPPALHDLLVDWLLEQPQVAGFVSSPMHGFGGEEHRMSAAEKVAGYRKGWMIQMHLPHNNALALLDRLKKAYAGSEIHYWMSPLPVAGHLGP